MYSVTIIEDYIHNLEKNCVFDWLEDSSLKRNGMIQNQTICAKNALPSNHTKELFQDLYNVYLLAYICTYSHTI